AAAFVFSSRRRHTRFSRDWSSDVCSSDLRTMDVNLFGPWTAAQLAAPLMERRGGGAIVNLLSPGAEHYMPDYAAVGVSKAALASLTMYLAVELAPRGVRVNAVSAGWVEGSEGEHSYRAEVSARVRPYV